MMIPIAQGRQGEIYALYLRNPDDDVLSHPEGMDGSSLINNDIFEDDTNDGNPSSIASSWESHHECDNESGAGKPNTDNPAEINSDDHGGIKNWRAVKLVYGPLNGKVKGKEPHNIRSEVEILKRLDHPNIIKLIKYEYNQDLFQHNLTLPLYPISLSTLLRDQSFPFSSSTHTLNYEIPKIISYQLLLAVTYLHSQNPPISHRDLNPSNIMFDLGGNLKLIDFGIAYSSIQIKISESSLSNDESLLDGAEEENDQFMFCDVGTGSYRAPELLFSPTSYDPITIDLWAIGCIISEFFRPHTSCLNSSSSSSGSDSGSDSDSNSEVEQDDLDDPLEDPFDFTSIGTKERKPLFDSTYGSLGLASSIFKVLGKPTIENWPEFTLLPDSTKIEFPSYPLKPLEKHLPELSNYHPANEIKDILEAINALLKLDPKKRIDAKDILRMDWFNDMSDSLPNLDWNGLNPWKADAVDRYERLEMNIRNENFERKWED